MKKYKAVKAVATTYYKVPEEVTVEQAEGIAFGWAEEELPPGWGVDFTEHQGEIVEREDTEDESC